MTRIVVGWAILTGLLLALGLDVGALIYLPPILLIVVGGFSLIIAQKLPPRFLLMLGAFTLGPCVIAAIIRGASQALFAQSGDLSNAAGNGAGWLGLALLCLAFVISLVAYRVREARRRQGNALAEVRGAERTPFVPQHLDGEEQQ